MRPRRLSPRGTAAETFLAGRGRSLEPSAGNPRIPEVIANAVASYDLDEGLAYEVWELVRCAPALDPAGQTSAAFLIAASLVATRRGSTRLPLEPGPLETLLAWLGAGKGDRVRLRSLLGARRGSRGAFEPLLGEDDDFKPLVIDDGCLYLQRLREFERRLAQALRERIESSMPPPDGLAAAFDSVIAQPVKSGADEVRLSGEQERAVLGALHLPLSVITGGPGTGKTSIIVALLRLLVRLGVPVESIALAAPTGKAAQRMELAIKRALQSLEPLDGADGELLERCPAPRTLHRLLGYSPTGDRFRHHENNPLAERVVIVDECSMVDLFLMDRLLRAVDPVEARLVLLGDADQLPSVEAGAVFKDLVPPEGASAAREWDGLVHASLPPPGAPAPAGELRARCAIRLTRSFRQDERDPAGRQILEAAALVNQGRGEDLLEVIAQRATAADVQFQGVELFTASTEAEGGALMDRWFAQRVRSLPHLDELLSLSWRLSDGQPDPLQRHQLEELFRHFEASRALCVTRAPGRATGAAAVNGALRSRWLDSRHIPDDKAPRLSVGEPVMAERNDYARGLFNGDQGLVLRVEEGAGRASARAVFARRDGFAAHLLDADSALTRCFAMTVHKAQGSEFDSVLLVLPDEEIPLLTREVLYTAITRARRSVVILGTAEMLLAGVARPLQRFSGVGERLTGKTRAR